MYTLLQNVDKHYRITVCHLTWLNGNFLFSMGHDIIIILTWVCLKEGDVSGKWNADQLEHN